MEKTIERTILNPIQFHLLQMFSIPMTENELDNLKKILLDFFDTLADKEFEKVWKEKGMSEKTIEEIDNTHRRTPYN
jgi:hypothetical protein